MNKTKVEAPSDVKAQAKAALKQWLRPARRFSGLVVACEIVSTFAWIAVAWGVSHALWAALNQQSVALALSVTAAGVMLRALALYGSESLAAKAGAKMVEAARSDVLSTLKTKGARMMLGADVGARTSQIMDRTAKLHGYAARYSPGRQMALLGPIITVTAIFTQSWLAGALLLGSIVILPAFIWLTASATANSAKKQQAALDALSGSFQSRAKEAGLIRAFRAVGRETATLSQASYALAQRTMRILRLAFLTTAVLEFFASVSIAMVAVYIGFKLLGEFPFETGETILFTEGMMALILAPEFFAPIRKLSGLHHDRADASAAALHLAPWIVNTRALPDVVRRSRLERAPTLTFDAVTLGYGEMTALHDLSFNAKAGEITVLAGPSGSGKTSALLALIGLCDRKAGRILVDNDPLGVLESLADTVAFMRQTPYVTQGSVRDAIALGQSGLSDTEIDTAASLAGVTDFAPDLNRPLGRAGQGLSGGQKQRVALARALARQAPIMLLDEPTAHLDPDAEAAFLKTLATLKGRATILMASHRPMVIEAADQCVWLTPSDTAVPAKPKEAQP